LDENISYESTVSKASPSIIEQAFLLRKNLRYVNSNIPRILKSQFNFKGRKSPDIGKIIIETLTAPNELVLDPFVGSGSYIISASETDRSFYGCELDSYTFNVVKTIFKKTDLNVLSQLFSDIKKACFANIRSLYETKCCNKLNYIKKLHFDPENNNYYNPKPHRDIKDGHNIIMLYKCPICGSRTKKFDKQDEHKLNSLKSIDTSNFPNHFLIENSRINLTSETGADKYSTNFSKRNKIALLKLQSAISNLPECHEKNLIQHFFVASLTLARVAQYGSSSDTLYQVMKTKAQDMNVWHLFEEKYNNFFKFYKQYIQGRLNWFDNNLKFEKSSYSDFIFTHFSDTKKADMIISDPPYYDQVPYLERNQLYRDWLFNFVDEKEYLLSKDDLTDEIVVTDAPTRKNKNYEQHIVDIDRIFKNFHYAVKTNGFVVLAVNLGKNKYLDLLSEYITSAKKNGFEYITRIDKTLSDPSIRKQSAFLNTFSKEMYLVFSKLPKNKRYWYIEGQNIENSIRKHIYNEIQNGSISYNLNKLIMDIENKIINNRTFVNSPQQRRIKKIIQDNFKIDQKQQVYLDEDKLYVDLEDSETLFIKLYDIIPVIVEKLLFKQNGSFILQDIYFEISDKLCNGEPRLLEMIINSPSKEADIENLILNFCRKTEYGYTRNYHQSKDSHKNKIDLRTIDPYGLEDLIKDLLIKEGYKDVTRMGGAGDRGVDIIATKKNIHTSKPEKVIFQVKRWIGNVGSEPIQRLNSVKVTDGFDYGVCITTSDYTHHGYQEGDFTGVKLLKGNDLLNRLEKHYKDKYFISDVSSLDN